MTPPSAPRSAFGIHHSAFSSQPSLRSRLVIASTIACLAAFTCAGVILFFSMRDSLYRQFDDALYARVTALAALVEQAGPQVHLQEDPSVMSGFSANQRRNYFEVLAADGTSVTRSISLGKAHLAPPPAPLHPGGLPTYYDAPLPDDRDGRAVAIAFLPRPADETRPLPPDEPHLPVTVVVASDTKRIEDNLFRVAKQLVLVCGCATAATAAALWWLISHQLRPVNDIAEQIARVGREDLSERLDPGPAPAELLPVVTRLNEMLARLGTTLDREKAFTADVAHELRTPISALEAALEVSGSRLREPEAYRQTLGKCLRTVRDMHALVDRLLTLARADARQLTVRPERVKVMPFVEEIWYSIADRAAKRDVRIDWRIPPKTTITTDPELLRLIVQNALDNAVAYAPEGSTIAVTVSTDDAGPALHFLNPAPGLTPDQVSRVFDRFWRADGSRQSGHSGLGLPLCQKIMQALGGQADATLAPPDSFHLTFRFPLS